MNLITVGSSCCKGAFSHACHSALRSLLTSEKESTTSSLEASWPYRSTWHQRPGGMPWGGRGRVMRLGEPVNSGPWARSWFRKLELRLLSEARGHGCVTQCPPGQVFPQILVSVILRSKQRPSAGGWEESNKDNECHFASCNFPNLLFQLWKRKKKSC